LQFVIISNNLMATNQVCIWFCLWNANMDFSCDYGYIPHWCLHMVYHDGWLFETYPCDCLFVCNSL